MAQLDPTQYELDSFWTYLAEVANQAFSTENYRLKDEVAAYNQLSGNHVPLGFLGSQYALWILSSRRLPEQMDRAIVKWIWQKPDVIRYLRVSLDDFKPRQIGYWLGSMNMLSRFCSWREVSMNPLNCLGKKCGKDGLWDFGSEIARIINFPLSDSRRQARNRRLDYSTTY